MPPVGADPNEKPAEAGLSFWPSQRPFDLKFVPLVREMQNDAVVIRTHKRLAMLLAETPKAVRP